LPVPEVQPPWRSLRAPLGPRGAQLLAFLGVAGRRAAFLEEPLIEQRIELPSAPALGERDEVGRRDVAVLVLGVPGAQDPEERLAADLVPY
jgi:hypothetical protein